MTERGGSYRRKHSPPDRPGWTYPDRADSDNVFRDHRVRNLRVVSGVVPDPPFFGQGAGRLQEEIRLPSQVVMTLSAGSCPIVHEGSANKIRTDMANPVALILIFVCTYYLVCHRFFCWNSLARGMDCSSLYRGTAFKTLHGVLSYNMIDALLFNSIFLRPR